MFCEYGPRSFRVNSSLTGHCVCVCVCVCDDYLHQLVLQEC